MSENIILSKTINELTEAPGVTATTSFPSQRAGATKAEKISASALGGFILESTTAEVKIKSLATKLDTAAIEAHTQSTDPHGDRAFASQLVTNHLSVTDPHGSKLYTDTSIASHSNKDDPHGDRKYTQEQISAHADDNDPHGDRAFAAYLQQQHSEESDAHGSKAFASNLMNTHKVQTDPHGDRIYSDNQLYTHNLNEDAHNILAKILAEIKKHNTDLSAHSLTEKLATLTQQINSRVNEAFAQKISTEVPPLVQGKVPESYLPNKVVLGSLAAFPALGVENTLYVDVLDKLLYLWVNNSYVPFSSNSGTNTYLTTDDIPEGASATRRYFTSDLEATLNSKLGNIKVYEGGSSIIEEVSIGTDNLNVKGLVGTGSVHVIDKGTYLDIGTSTYDFEAQYNDDVTLTNGEGALDAIQQNEIVTVVGTVKAIEPIESGDLRIIRSFNSWDVKATFGISAALTTIVAPSTFILASNGLVLTCKAPATNQVEIYSATNLLLGTGTTLADGSCTITLNTAQLDGALLKGYTLTPEGLRSEPTYFYANNTTALKSLNAVSILPTGLSIRGNTSRLADVEILDSTQQSLGKIKADTNGNFIVGLTKAVITGDVLTIKVVLGTIVETTTHNVNLGNIILPYDITTNLEHTVIKGKAEPSSLITLGVGTSLLSGSTDSSGNFIIYTFSNPVSDEDLIFRVVQETREGSVGYIMDTLPVPVNSNPIVSQNVSTYTESFIEKEIKSVLGTPDVAEIDLVFDPITRNINVKGKNKNKTNLTWIGSLQVERYSQGD